MTGVLILAHGSREKQTEATLDQVLALLKHKLQIEHIERAFLQFSETNLEKGLAKLIASGVTNIKVIPYFLFEGVHIKEDIPAEIEEFKQSHRGVTITMGQTLGADPRLADILADRVTELLAAD